MLEYKITKIIEAGLYTKDGEKVMNLTDTCMPHLLGETVICKKDNTEIEFKNELINFIKQWQSNPLHWTNNKRRMHGYAPLRKSVNSKRRFYPDKFILFSLIQGTIDKEMPILINKQIEQLTNVKNWGSNQ